MFEIQVLNNISAVGINQLPSLNYKITQRATSPDAILLRSYDMHHMDIPASVKVVARAGTGVNNIPIEALTKRGIPVLNTPGANANAVKELVIASMLLFCRNLFESWIYLHELKKDDPYFEREIEASKQKFVGCEIQGKTLGVIGLGNIGTKVANAASSLGMRVFGYDPSISVKNAWELSASVISATHLDELITEADFISLHIPLLPSTKNMLTKIEVNAMKNGVVLLNFSRDGLIEHELLRHALAQKQLRAYITDFPSSDLVNYPNVISLPHLGASTQEAEENCARIAVTNIRNFLENGSIGASVNFPMINLPPLPAGIRLAIVNANIPNMIAEISSKLGARGININRLVNQSRESIAYSVFDLSEDISDEVLSHIGRIPGVIQIRKLSHLD